jgi:hypothetical protein
VPENATDDLSQMAQALDNSGDYRVLRRLVPREVITPASADQQIKVGVHALPPGRLKFDFMQDGIDDDLQSR